MDADFAIVGAGIAGAALARVLAADAGVLLLERESQPGLHSTGRSAAMFMESYGSPQGRALTRASRALYAAPPADFGDTPVLSPRGALYVGWQGQQALLDAMQAELQATGSTIERLDAAATLARVPVLRADGLAGALWEADAMDIDVQVLHQGLLRGARRHGAGVLCDAEVVQAVHDGRAWTVTLADGRTLRARRLINAAGAWADELARRCGSRALGVQPRRRSAFTFDAPPGVAFRGWPVTAAIAEHWYFKPDAGQLLGSPANADPVPAHDVVAEELDIAIGIAAIEADTTLRIRRPRRTWAGLRSFAPDGEMLIGFDEAGLFWLAGQGGWGIQSAQGAALLAAALLRGEALPEALRREGVDVPALSPRRRPPQGD